MKKTLLMITTVCVTILSSSAYAEGCLKGAAVGGVAGHIAGKHTILGAVGGCIVGRHMANKDKEQEKKEKEQLELEKIKAQQNQQDMSKDNKTYHNDIVK